MINKVKAKIEELNRTLHWRLFNPENLADTWKLGSADEVSAALDALAERGLLIAERHMHCGECLEPVWAGPLHERPAIGQRCRACGEEFDEAWITEIDPGEVFYILRDPRA